MKKIKNASEKGFTLVELAIVLIIIGLIVGGVLKGQDLIESAQLKSVMVQVNNSRTATSTFLDKYDAYPGDFDSAKAQIDTSLTNGNQNGIVDGSGLNGESLQFWRHLSKANMLSGIEGTGATIGSGAPETKAGGGLTIERFTLNGVTTHWFRLGDGKNANRNTDAVLTPSQARSIDVKSDDGNPVTGVVQSATGVDATANPCIGGGTYQNATVASCIVYFQL